MAAVPDLGNSCVGGIISLERQKNPCTHQYPNPFCSHCVNPSSLELGENCNIYVCTLNVDKWKGIKPLELSIWHFSQIILMKQ